MKSMIASAHFARAPKKDIAQAQRSIVPVGDVHTSAVIAESAPGIKTEQSCQALEVRGQTKNMHSRSNRENVDNGIVHSGPSGTPKLVTDRRSDERMWSREGVKVALHHHLLCDICPAVVAESEINVRQGVFKAL